VIALGNSKGGFVETPTSDHGPQGIVSDHDAAAARIGYAVPTTGARNDSEPVTRGDVACIAVKLIGLYMFVQAIPSLIPAISAVARYRSFDLQEFMVALLLPAIICAVGSFLFLRAPRLARYFLPTNIPAEPQQHTHGPTQLHAMALSVAGVVLFVLSAPYLLWVFYMILSSDHSRSIQRSASALAIDYAPSLVTHGIQAALGVWLFLGSKGLAAWWGRLRHPEFRDPDALQPVDGSAAGDDAVRND
jgi:hypothetical protein